MSVVPKLSILFFFLLLFFSDFVDSNQVQSDKLAGKYDVEVDLLFSEKILQNWDQ